MPIILQFKVDTAEAASAETHLLSHSKKPVRIMSEVAAGREFAAITAHSAFTAGFVTEETSTTFLHSLLALMAAKTNFPVVITLFRLGDAKQQAAHRTKSAELQFSQVHIAGFRTDGPGFLFDFASTGGSGESDYFD